MSKRKTQTPIINKPKPTSNLRRSPRLQQSNPKPNSRNNSSETPISKTPSRSSKQKEFSKKTRKEFKEKDNEKSVELSVVGLRRSPRFSKVVEEISWVRRSPGFGNSQNVHKNVTDKCNVLSSSGVLKCTENVKTGNDLRRSPRFCNRQNIDKYVSDKSRFLSGEDVLACTENGKTDNDLRRSPRLCNRENVDRNVTDKSSNLSSNCILTCTENGKTGNDFRRSPRFLNVRNTIENVVTDKSKILSKKEVLMSSEIGKNLVEKRERKGRSSSKGCKEVLGDGGEVKVGNVGGEDGEEVVTKERKRKRGEEGDGDGDISGWTKEQEVALQRAYFTMKPTPHFWKKVSKMVPGKSAHECFDKVHSESSTPLHPRPRSRASKAKSSPMRHQLSASKLLKPFVSKTKRPSRSRQKTHLAQKTVRHLLQKHYNVEKDYQADLFSILEPTTNSSTQTFQESSAPSTPKHALLRSGFVRKCNGSSSGHKKSLSRFSKLSAAALISPPVLKQVKNKALHEKYIDQLHCRDAKRRAASARRPKIVPGSDYKMESHYQNLDVVKTAKNALVSDASDVINQFQRLQAIADCVSSEFDDDGVDIDDNDIDDDDEP